MSELVVQPSIPVHVEEYSDILDGGTCGTTHCALTPVNCDPVSTRPDQLAEMYAALLLA
jgi:hypothetical protein